ncbi:MAG: hypothetical protein QMD36_01700 [Candidatus Aenigmarchaeota archaeon]|nr:hypothetical protein [Candidatus Aenigmarchaeota archaeon]
MITSKKINWLIWVLAIVLLVITIPNYGSSTLTLLFVLVILAGINLYHQELHRKRVIRIREIVNSIDLKSLEDGIKKFNRQQKECYDRILDFEDRLEKYKIEQEKKYRDVVRKVLDLDNKLNKKFKLMGETIVKLSKDIKKGG